MDAPPTPELLTERLRLQPPRPDDLEDHLEMDLDPEVMRYIGPLREREENRRRLLAKIAEGWPPVGAQFHVRWRHSGEFLGWCALWPLEDRDGQPVELGYRYRRAVWGRGVAGEAAVAVLRYGFETLALDPIVGVTDHENRGSQAVLAKAGLRRAGNVRAYGSDVAFFVARRADWLAERAQ